MSNSVTPTVAVDRQPVSQELTKSPGSSLVTVRCLQDTQEDAEFVGRLQVEAFRSKYVHNVGEHNLEIVKGIVSDTNRGNSPTFYSRTFVAEYEGKRAGVITFQFHGDKSEGKSDNVCDLGCYRAYRYCMFDSSMQVSVSRDKCYIHHICVDSLFRGKGIGKELMKAVENEARRHDCSMLYLHVSTTNRAQHLYEREGYQITDTVSCCVYSTMGEQSSRDGKEIIIPALYVLKESGHDHSPKPSIQASASRISNLEGFPSSGLQDFTKHLLYNVHAYMTSQYQKCTRYAENEEYVYNGSMDTHNWYTSTVSRLVSCIRHEGV